MKSKKFARKLLFGEVVLEKVISPFNGEISVTEDILGRTRVVIGGLTQSGRIIEKIWNDAVKSLEKKPDKVLILGFGAGSAAWVISRRFPKAEIIGVEIDPEMLKFGRKYFDIGQIENLKLENLDANRFVKKCQGRFNLILVDLYLGAVIPKKCQTEAFFRDLKRLLASSGTAIFNHLYSQKEEAKAEKFRERLEKIFPKVSSLRSVANILFKAQDEPF